MIPKSLKIRHSVLLTGLFLALSCGIVQAQFVINGFGLSGNATVLDTVVESGDFIYVVLTVDVPEGWEINSVGLPGESRFELTGYFYDTNPPFADPSAIEALAIDSTRFEVDIEADPQVVRFRTTLPEGLGLNLVSLQMNAVIIGKDDLGEPQTSEEVLSYLQIGDVLPVSNPVDEDHLSYLTITPPSISRPIITSPNINETVGRVFNVVYDQPLDAVRHSLTLELREVPDFGGLIVHRLYLADTLAGTDKTLLINSLALSQSEGVDSLGGQASLNHNSVMSMRLYYTIANGQGGQSDTGIVQNLFVDLQTELPSLTEPRVGSESPDPEVRVLFRLPERADTVQLIFAVDSLSQVEDPFSPHIITLIPDHYFAGEHYLILDGSRLGTGNPNVWFNNNGPTDSLVAQALYNVSLSYGDMVGNPVAVVTNEGYIWPEDLTTVPPRIIAPATNTVDNNTFWIQFELPETPLVGSVYLSFTALPAYPGSPHTIHLGNLASSGITGLFLNSEALDLSGLPVTGIEGGNSLNHGSRYFVRVFYQDHYGNDEAGSAGRLATYDGATELPILISPVDNDSFAFAGTEVLYTQPEDATPGSVKLIIEQTGGPETDLLSPHTMYLSDPDSGTAKSVTVMPGFIGIGEGIDSVANAGSLVARGRYRMTLAYQDVLLNTEASVFVRELYFPSGSSVSIRGSTLSSEVIPGASNVGLIHFALSSFGESAMRSITLGVEGDIDNSDITTDGMILWTSVDSLLQPEFDQPLDTLDSWFTGDMKWDSISVAISEAERHIIIGGTFPVTANGAHAVNLVLRSGDDVDCGGDPVYCAECPIGMPDVALPVMVSSMYVEEDTTFSSLVVNWIVESEYNVLGFRLWRSDNESNINEVIASYSSDEELYGRGNAVSAKRYRYVDRGLRNELTYTYRLDVVSMDGITVHHVDISASGSPAPLPSTFELKKVYPNPFNAETTIEFVVPFSEQVELVVYNLLGQPVRELIDAQLAPSVYHARWDGTNDFGQHVPSGLYIARLKAAGRFDATQKILLVR